MKYLVTILLLASSSTAWSCTCGGIAPIELAIAWQPILVTGEVVSLEQEDSPGFGTLTYSATLRVAKVLKGSVGTDEITVVHTWCYASLTPGDMKLHHTYVLPLAEPAPDPGPMSPDTPTAIIGAKPGQYEMAGCAHSGLELMDGALYKFEWDAGGKQRRMQRYMSYPIFRLWWPIGQVAMFGIGVVAMLSRMFGIRALVMAAIALATCAYFAARYRPWVLIPVLLLAGLLCAVNLVALLGPGMVMVEHRLAYRVLSLLAPAIILACAMLGYRIRR